MTAPVQPERLYRRVADQIIESIRKGVYAVGERLPAERELAEGLGVSRPTVREAMIALEILGVVEIRDRSGIYIIDSPAIDEKVAESEALTPDDLSVGAFELIEARIIIEGAAAGLAAAVATEQDIESLQECIALMDSDDIEVSEEADKNFHLYIANMTHNGALAAVVEMLWDLRLKSPLAASIMTRARGGGLDARSAEHKDILAAFQARDPLKAREAMCDHLEQVREYLLDATETAELNALKKRLMQQRQNVIGRTKRLAG